MTRAGQHVAVVGVDLSEPVFAGAGQVQRVAGAQERPRGQLSHPVAGVSDQSGGHREPAPYRALLVLLELLEHLTGVACRKAPLTTMPLDDAGELETAEVGRAEPASLPRQLPYAFRAWLVEIALGDIGRVEVHQPRSRSSDW